MKRILINGQCHSMAISSPSIAGRIGSGGAPPPSPAPRPLTKDFSVLLYSLLLYSIPSFSAFSLASCNSFSAVLPIKQHIIRPIKMATIITARTIQNKVQSKRSNSKLKILFSYQVRYRRTKKKRQSKSKVK